MASYNLHLSLEPERENTVKEKNVEAQDAVEKNTVKEKM